MRILKLAAAAAALGLLLGGPAAAEYPDRPIRIVAPYAPGGNIDVTSRVVANKLKDILNQTVLVDNKAGASGMIGTDAVVRSPPDGYTLLVSANSLVSIPAIYGNAPYDWRTGLQPISLIQTVPGVLVVTPDSPIKTMAEFIAAAKKNPGKLAIADSGAGTTNHLAIEMMGHATGTKYTLVHYKGSGAASIDVIAGQVPTQLDQLNSAIGHIKAGKLRALAVTSLERVPQLPDVPTMAESGVAGLERFEAITFTGLLGPAKLPPEILAKLNAAVALLLKDPEVLKRFDELTVTPVSSTPEEYAAMLDKEERTMVPLIKEIGIKLE